MFASSPSCWKRWSQKENESAVLKYFNYSSKSDSFQMLRSVSTNLRPTFIFLVLSQTSTDFPFELRWSWGFQLWLVFGGQNGCFSFSAVVLAEMNHEKEKPTVTFCIRSHRASCMSPSRDKRCEWKLAKHVQHINGFDLKCRSHCTGREKGSDCSFFSPKTSSLPFMGSATFHTVWCTLAF